MLDTLLGVCSNVWQWLDSVYHQDSWYLGRVLEKVNKLFSSAKPLVNIVNKTKMIHCQVLELEADAIADDYLISAIHKN